jgi:tetratricopeptide (TPR) repeat protein
MIDDDGRPMADDGRTVALRLARLHLRMGSLSLARAELESFAGSGLLDEPALLDLAEARWRTGDLAGAGEAAEAALTRGVTDPLAHVIAAEAVAADGRPAEARRLAGQALEGLDTTLDVLFAGMPRSLIWPADVEPAPGPDAAAGPVPAPRAWPGDDDRSPASAAAAEAFAGGRGALGAGDIPAAAVRLGVAIRLEPKYAQAVLTALGDRASVPLLALIAGDALRLLGREHEALEAYDRARGKAPDPEPADGPSFPDGDQA